jgi:hypothetical protein
MTGSYRNATAEDFHSAAPVGELGATGAGEADAGGEPMGVTTAEPGLGATRAAATGAAAQGEHAEQSAELTTDESAAIIDMMSLAHSTLPEDILVFLLGNWINDARSLGRFRAASRGLKALVDAAVCMKLPRVKCVRCCSQYFVAVLHPCCVVEYLDHWQRLAKNTKKKVCRHHPGEWSSGVWSCCGDNRNSPTTGCIWSSVHLPDDRIQAHMLNPMKRFLGRDTWPVFREYYAFVNIMNTENDFTKRGRANKCHNTVRADKHSFEILGAWRGYDVRGHYQYVCSTEMDTLVQKMRWRSDRLYNCSNPCFKAETPVGTCFWYKDGGMSYNYSMFIVLTGQDTVQVSTDCDAYDDVADLFTGQDQFRWHALPGLLLSV